MRAEHPRLGMMLMIAATFVMAGQDAISRHLASEYNTIMVVMIRYWFFAAFVIALAYRQHGSIRLAAATEQPRLQIARGVILAIEICVMVQAFTLLGLIESQAVFICYPLIVAALSGPLLGERVGPLRWLAIAAGAIGVLIILNPGTGVFQPAAVVPLASAVLFALYNLLTRKAAHTDSAATSLFWTGTVGAVVMTVAGLRYWEPMTGSDWQWMALLCCTGVLGHFLLIKTYEVAEASTVQPFAYFQLVFGAGFGMLIYGEVLRLNVATGAGIVIAAGLFTLWRARRRAA